MCEIAPFCMKCEIEIYRPNVMCSANALFYYWSKMLQGIPLIGRFVEDYHCSHFEKDDKENNDEID